MKFTDTPIDKQPTIDKQTPIYVFGNTEYTDVLLKDFNVIGIIDDFSSEALIKGVERVSLSNIRPDATIISTVNNSRAFHAMQMLRDKSFKNCLFIGSLINQYPSSFKHTYLYQAQHAMRQLDAQMQQVAASFADETSHQQFSQIVNFRKTLNINFLSEMKVKIDQQYFEPFVYEQAFDCLLDGGAYDGHDSQQFVDIFPNYQKIYLIEPQSENLALIHKRFQSEPRCELVHACLGSRANTVRLSGEGTSAKIAEEGELVAMRTIDSFKTSGKTLVKLDIEGAEVDCLKGAMNALSDPSYSFAISAYHLPNDFWDIYQILNAAPIKRKFYFRHYSSGFAESVIFAV